MASYQEDAAFTVCWERASSSSTEPPGQSTRPAGLRRQASAATPEPPCSRCRRLSALPRAVTDAPGAPAAAAQPQPVRGWGSPRRPHGVRSSCARLGGEQSRGAAAGRARAARGLGRARVLLGSGGLLLRSVCLQLGLVTQLLGRELLGFVTVTALLVAGINECRKKTLGWRWEREMCLPVPCQSTRFLFRSHSTSCNLIDLTKISFETNLERDG